MCIFDKCNNVLLRDFLPGEQGQEVLGIGRGRGRKKACKVSEAADDFFRADVLFTQITEVERLVTLAEALAGFVYQ